MASDSLPGIVQVPDDGKVTVVRKYSRTALSANRISGEFLARSKNHVDHVKDGWVVTDDDGYVRGLEDADFQRLYMIPPDSVTIDAVEFAFGGLITATHDVALNASAGGPAANATKSGTGSSITFGSIPASITYAHNAGANPTFSLTGTPLEADEGDYYFEVTWTYNDGTSWTTGHVLSVV